MNENKYVEEFDIQGDHIVCAYSMDNRKTPYGIKVKNDILSIAQNLLELENDIQELNDKMKRINRLRKTRVGKWFGLRKNFIEYYDMMSFCQFQQVLITRAVATLLGEDKYKELQEHSLVSKLFKKNEQSESGESIESIDVPEGCEDQVTDESVSG